MIYHNILDKDNINIIIVTIYTIMKTTIIFMNKKIKYHLKLYIIYYIGIYNILYRERAYTCLIPFGA